MRALRAVTVVVAVVVLGWLVCPRPPGLHTVNPDILLSRAISASDHAAYSAQFTAERNWFGQPAKSPSGMGLDCYGSVSTPGPWTLRCIGLLRRNYTPLVEGEDVIAGRPVWVLRLKPHSKHMPWRQLWIDKKTYVALAQRDWSARNEVKCSTTTTDITYGKPAGGPRLKPESTRGNLRTQIARAAEALGGTLILPGFVPRGFELLSVDVDKKGVSVQIVYTDGMYGISVIEGREAETAGRELRPGRVYDWGQGMIVCRRVGGKRVLLVADLPVADMEKMASSLR